MWCSQRHVLICWNHWIQQNKWAYWNWSSLSEKEYTVASLWMGTRAYQCETVLLGEHKNSVNMQLDPSSTPHVWDMAWIPNCHLIFFGKLFFICSLSLTLSHFQIEFKNSKQILFIILCHFSCLLTIRLKYNSIISFWILSCYLFFQILFLLF